MTNARIAEMYESRIANLKARLATETNADYIAEMKRDIEFLENSVKNFRNN
jgi:hypothetical protein